MATCTLSHRQLQGGDRCEVTPSEEGFQGAWFSATVVSGACSLLTVDAQVEVRFDDLFSDNSGSEPLLEMTPVRNVRPQPPESPIDFHEAAVPGDALELWHDGAWWRVVLRCKRAASTTSALFVVCYEPANIEHCVGLERLRPGWEWRGGEWCIAARLDAATATATKTIAVANMARMQPIGTDTTAEQRLRQLLSEIEVLSPQLSQASLQKAAERLHALVGFDQRQQTGVDSLLQVLPGGHKGDAHCSIASNGVSPAASASGRLPETELEQARHEVTDCEPQQASPLTKGATTVAFEIEAYSDDGNSDMAEVEVTPLVGARRARHRRVSMTAAEAKAQASREGLELVKSTVSVTGYSHVVYDGRKGGPRPYTSYAPGKRCKGSCLGTFATAEEAALVHARHVGNTEPRTCHGPGFSQGSKDAMHQARKDTLVCQSPSCSALVDYLTALRCARKLGHANLVPGIGCAGCSKNNRAKFPVKQNAFATAILQGKRRLIEWPTRLHPEASAIPQVIEQKKPVGDNEVRAAVAAAMAAAGAPKSKSRKRTLGASTRHRAVHVSSADECSDESGVDD